MEKSTKIIILCIIILIIAIGIALLVGVGYYTKKDVSSPDKLNKLEQPEPIATTNNVQNIESTEPINITVPCMENEIGSENPIQLTTDKPIIYLYPTEETEIRVTVNKPENFTTTYPKYTDGWKVVAKPDGTLTDCKTGRSLYALYWEGKREKMPKLETGFIVKREDTANFLEEKLAILGLNEREAEEFIVYWLPQLEKNPYNWIYFESLEEIEENMKLEISPKPDTCIRVMMVWKGLNKAISVPEQVLEKQERSGYTAVEWGGTEVK